MENEKWYKAYNCLTSDKDGVSLEDFKFGDMVMETIMMRMQFEPLVKKMLKRFMLYKPATQA